MQQTCAVLPTAFRIQIRGRARRAVWWWVHKVAGFRFAVAHRVLDIWWLFRFYQRAIRLFVHLIRTTIVEIDCWPLDRSMVYFHATEALSSRCNLGHISTLSHRKMACSNRTKVIPFLGFSHLLEFHNHSLSHYPQKR